jgi:hypothetical protein
MSEFEDLEARLAREAPDAPRPGLRDEVLAGVQRKLHAPRWGRLAVAATLLLAAVLASRIEDTGHRQRVAAFETESVHPRVTRAFKDLSPFLTSNQMKIRLLLLTRRRSDLEWARYMTALQKAGGKHG